MTVRRALAGVMLALACGMPATAAPEAAAFDEGRRLRATDSAAARARIGRAADAGHAQAMFILSSMLFDGEGGERNVVLAKAWLERAATLEHPEAMQQLALYLQDGGGGYARDEQRAAHLMRRVGHAMKHRTHDSEHRHH